jgi:hypothetical protein
MVRARRGVMDVALGSWRRTAIVGVLLVVVFTAVVLLATAVGPLRRTSFPGHPYPPTGYVQNPFSSNPDDLLNATDVARVRAEFERDSNIDLGAVESGDTAILSQARTGNALGSLRRLIDANTAQGIAEREQNSDDTATVGRLPDPNDPRRVTWCVEERGSGTTTYFMRSTGQTVRTESLSFDDRIWLVPVGVRYLITDVEVLSPAR